MVCTLFDLLFIGHLLFWTCLNAVYGVHIVSSQNQCFVSVTINKFVIPGIHLLIRVLTTVRLGANILRDHLLVTVNCAGIT